MNNLTLVWIAFPFFVGFLIYLLPRFDRVLALGGALVSAAFAIQLFVQQTPITLRLLDHFGVSLVLDPLTAFFILTNALVTAAVVLYCWRSDRTTFFYAQTIILHGSVNAALACSDFISLYMALEVLSIASFLLIAYPRSDRAIWVGLRYLFVSNVAMLFYLVGAVLVYKAHHSFDFSGLRGAPPEALALIFLGLLIKGGIFVSGLWLPLTHSESEAPVSALMSGVVVKAAVLPTMKP
jgi:multicomponent Na+:H+ antiporter subunit D